MTTGKMVYLVCILFSLTAVLRQPVLAQSSSERQAPVSSKAESLVDEAPITVKKTITYEGKPLGYIAETGRLLVYRENRTPFHRMSYIAYTVPSSTPRAITFLWNGGPTGPATGLHMGAFGPRRIVFPAFGIPTRPPYTMTDNPDTLLDQSDLVFVDAPSTGWSEPVGDGTFKEIAGVDGDARSFASFIHRYLITHRRFNSQKFILGESYGTIRAAIVSRLLHNEDVDLNGVILLGAGLDLSNIGVNFQSNIWGPDDWYVGTLPTFAVSGLAHGRTTQTATVGAWAEKARVFASGPYAAALRRGDALDPGTRADVAQKLSALTGLSKQFVLENDLRVSTYLFRKELLRSSGEVIGRFDTRNKAADGNVIGTYPTFDPSVTAYNGITIASFYEYMKGELQVANTKPYATSSHVLEIFDWEHRVYGGETGGGQTGPLPDRSSFSGEYDLGATIRENPRMKVFFGNGYYDLASPFFMAEKSAAHLNIGPLFDSNVRVKLYETGHMIYQEAEKLHSLRMDLRSFYRDAM